MNIQYDISSSTNSFERVFTPAFILNSIEIQSNLNEYNQQMYDWEIKLKGFENTWPSKDSFYELRCRRFQIENTKFFSYIQMKIETPDITPQYLKLEATNDLS